MLRQNKPLSILTLIIKITESNFAYNEFAIPLSDKYDFTICTYFNSRITPGRRIKVFEGDGSLMGFFRNLKTALAAKEYDIIHAHTPHVGCLFLLYRLISRRSIAPRVYTFHSSFQNYKLRNQLLLIPVFAFFQRVVCCSNASFATLPRFFKWLSAKRLLAIQNGVALERIDRVINHSPQNNPKPGFTVIFVGRLVEIKNPLTLLTAFHQSVGKSGRLVYLGDGKLRQRIIAKSVELDLMEHVELPGMLPRKVVYQILDEADLFVSTSYGEGLPVAVVEAMACRCPVILSDIKPHREIAENVDFIPLIPPNDVSGFAREIKQFQQMPHSERQKVSEQCRQLVEEKFNLSVMLRKYEKVYHQLAHS